MNDFGTQITTYQTNSWVGVVGYILFVIALWPMLVKAGKPGWGAIIPIYNVYLVIKLAGYSGFTILLFLGPFVNIVWGIILAVGLARAFGKGGVFGFFLLFLFWYVGFLILGYGSSKYIGRA